MTTSRSSVAALKTQADRIAATMKAIDRGDKIDVRFAEKVEAARGKPSIKFGIVMDDKIVTIDIPWATLREADAVGLSEYILKQMRGGNDGTH